MADVRQEISAELVRVREELAAEKARVAAVSAQRDRLAADRGQDEAATLMTEQLSVVTVDRDRAVATLRDVRGQYEQLAGQYRWLAAQAKAQVAAYQRLEQRFEPMAVAWRDWEYLAGLLYEARGGRPANEQEQRILSVWVGRGDQEQVTAEDVAMAADTADELTADTEDGHWLADEDVEVSG